VESGAQWSLRLADFGLSRFRVSNYPKYLTAIIGKPHYSPPVLLGGPPPPPRPSRHFALYFGTSTFTSLSPPPLPLPPKKKSLHHFARVKQTTQMRWTCIHSEWFCGHSFTKRWPCFHATIRFCLKRDLLCFVVVYLQQPMSELSFAYTVVDKIVHRGERPDMSSNCPPCLAKLISDCWDKDASNRPIASEALRRLPHDSH
jgi:hypothetical protein